MKLVFFLPFPCRNNDGGGREDGLAPKSPIVYSTPMKQYKYLLIDADGTFLDFKKSEMRALNKTIDYIGWKDRDLFINTFLEENRKAWEMLEEGTMDPGKINAARFSALCGELGKREKPALSPEEMGEYYLSRLEEGDFLIEGGREFLDYLRGKYILILATNGLARIQRGRLTRAGLKGHFDRLAISQEIGFQKPLPAYFEKAMEGYDYRKDEVLMIGDSLTSDMAGADAFGIDSCWFNPDELLNDGTASPTYEISRLEEIRNLL